MPSWGLGFECGPVVHRNPNKGQKRNRSKAKAARRARRRAR